MSIILKLKLILDARSLEEFKTKVSVTLKSSLLVKSCLTTFSREELLSIKHLGLSAQALLVANALQDKLNVCSQSTQVD